MAYVSRDLMRLALHALAQNYSPLLLVSLPCMLAKRIPTCSSVSEAQRKAIPFGSNEESEWLNRYFRIPGGPAGKPFYMPGTQEWVQEQYPGRSLQRRRKDFDGTVFYHPDASRWALTSSAAETLKEKVLVKAKPVPLLALMVWMWRSKAVEGLPKALRDFVNEVGFKRDDLVGTVYDQTIDVAFADAGLADEPLSSEMIAELVGAAPPPPIAPDLESAVKILEQTLKDEEYVSAPGLIQRIIGGWMVGDVVVLVGPTGSGKTALAGALAKGLQTIFGRERFFHSFLEVTPDLDVAQFLGYENLAGHFTPGRFAKEVLFAGSPTDPRLVVLDEWNLAQIDAYFAPVLSVIESKRPMRLPGQLKHLTAESAEDAQRAQPLAAEGSWSLPEDTFFLATCNSWADEPETRLPISGPVKRRCRIIPIPNVLALRYDDGKRDAIYAVCDTLLVQERKAVELRRAAGQPSVWDTHRSARLEAIGNTRGLQERTHERLVTLASILLSNPYSRDVFTIGILRDILLSCVYAPPGSDFDALGQQVADKVLHQLQGEPKILEVTIEQCKDFPNSAELKALGKRMGAGGSEKRIRPLV